MVALDKLHEEEEDYVEKELLQKPEQPQPLQTVDPPSYVDQALIDFHLNSKLSPELPVQDISLDDLEMGETLGTGGFGVVKSARWQGHEYALKMLRDDLEPNRFPVGAADLWKEAEFLAALKHKHVIGIHAKQMNLDDLENNFILLDKLNQSLHSKMNEWKQEDYKVRDRNEKRLKLLHGRLKVCLDIADALQYLHQHNVIFRDLKDENLGFDEEGNIKLFDFGLAKELKEDNKAATGKYRLSGNTGSLAYMAPEVAKGWKYDKTVDVYSFGILLWEIASLRPAFESYSKEEDMHRVWNGDERPPMENWWPVELQWLLKKCWAYFAKSRPDFDLVKETLQEIIYSSDDEEEEQIRSIRSFRFGSRRSQKLSGSSQNSREAPRRATTRPAEFQHVPPKQQKGKFLGIF